MKLMANTKSTVKSNFKLTLLSNSFSSSLTGA